MGSGRWSESVEGAFDAPIVQSCQISNEAQQKQILRTMNSARSIHSLAQQASAYMTTSTVPASLPEYVKLDPFDDWTSSALMATAIETVTLPSRLREAGGRQASLSLLEDMLNTDGKQNIFELAASVPQRMFSTTANGSADEETPSTSNGNGEISHADAFQPDLVLDIRYATELYRRSRGTGPHIFSRAVIQRGLIGHSEAVAASAEPNTDAVVEK